MEKSAASPRGAQAVLRRAELGQTLQVHLDGGRPCAKFVALVSDAQTALYVYDSDTGLEPETVHVLSQQRGHSVDAGERKNPCLSPLDDPQRYHTCSQCISSTRCPR